MKQTIRKILCLVLLFLVYQKAMAIAPIPASTQPGVIGNIISESLPSPSTPSVKPSLQTPEEPKVPYNAEAAKIRFTLKKIILEGNTVYTNQELEELYKDKLNKTFNHLNTYDTIFNMLRRNNSAR